RQILTPKTPDPMQQLSPNFREARKLRLELVHPFVGDIGKKRDHESSQLLVIPERLQCRIVHLRAADVQKLELLERAEMFHPRGRDIAGIQVQALEVDESRERFEPV